MGGIKRTRTGLLLKKEGDRNMGSRSKEEQTEGHSKMSKREIRERQ